MTKSKSYSTVVWMGLAALGLSLTACSWGGSTGPTATGLALADAPIAGTVTLHDSSVPMQARTAPASADGRFSMPVAGLTAPYLLRVEWTAPSGSRRFYGVSESNENVDVNPITDMAFRGNHQDDDESNDDAEDDRAFESSDRDGKHGSAAQARLLLAKLNEVLAPLLARYGITDVRTDRDAVRALLLDVKVTRDHRIITVTNRATGGIIFQGPVYDLASGTFTPANMPAGPGTPNPISCTAFTYSAYGACQPGNTQTRTVLTSSPAGCTGGAPTITQSCSYVPPVNTCTAFTYSAYGACQPDSTQTRAVLTSSPAGCTGGTPVTAQACTYVPPVNTCTAFTYSAYAACQPNNTQTRTVLTSSPAGCTGGTPVTTQACTYVPPVTTCTSFTYSAYGACQANNTQTRTVLTSSPAGCTGGSPVTLQACVFVPPIDGAALYTQFCSGCHGNSKKGSSASSIQSAINSNVGGMGSVALRALTPAQVSAIAAAP